MDAPTLRRSLLVLRLDPSFLAFVAAIAVLGAFTRLRLIEPYGRSDVELLEFERLVTVATAATVLAHALITALAARARRPLVGVALLLAVTSVLPWVVDGARTPVQSVLSRIAPRLCAYEPEYCPPSGWSPLTGLLVGALLAPVVATAIRVRRDGAYDAPARTLFVTGLWIVLLTTALRLASVTTFGPMLFAWAVAGACMLAAMLDTLRRVRRLRALLGNGRAVVTEARVDDPGDLRPYAYIRGAACDHVLRLDDRRFGPYRRTLQDQALARVPNDVTVVERALAARLRTQRIALLAAIAAFVITAR